MIQKFMSSKRYISMLAIFACLGLGVTFQNCGRFVVTDSENGSTDGNLANSLNRPFGTGDTQTDTPPPRETSTVANGTVAVATPTPIPTPVVAAGTTGIYVVGPKNVIANNGICRNGYIVLDGGDGQCIPEKEICTSNDFTTCTPTVNDCALGATHIKNGARVYAFREPQATSCGEPIAAGYDLPGSTYIMKKVVCRNGVFNVTQRNTDGSIVEAPISYKLYNSCRVIKDPSACIVRGTSVPNGHSWQVNGGLWCANGQGVSGSGPICGNIPYYFAQYRQSFACDGRFD